MILHYNESHRKCRRQEDDLFLHMEKSIKISVTIYDNLMIQMVNSIPVLAWYTEIMGLGGELFKQVAGRKIAF